MLVCRCLFCYPFSPRNRHRSAASRRIWCQDLLGSTFLMANDPLEPSLYSWNVLSPSNKNSICGMQTSLESVHVKAAKIHQVRFTLLDFNVLLYPFFGGQSFSHHFSIFWLLEFIFQHQRFHQTIRPKRSTRSGIDIESQVIWRWCCTFTQGSLQFVSWNTL